MLAQLIELPSVSCTNPDQDQSNFAVISLLAHWLEDLGFAVDIMEVQQEPRKANLIATLGSGPGGLVLAGHTDTVPYDGELWRFDPLKLTANDNRWYGLGTSDMKGFFPIAIEAAKKFLGTELKQPLIILATADEESSMCGAQALTDAGKPIARHALIGEPTGNRPIRLHKGIMMESIIIQGQSGHSSDPALGNNAIEIMHQVLSEIMQFREELKQRYQNPAFNIVYPTLNLGCIHGGDNPNRICGSCELQIDLRPIPGMEIDELRHLLLQRTRHIATERKAELRIVPLFPGIPAFETAASAEIVRVCEKLTGHKAAGVNFGTEAPFLQQLGMDTIVLGPGDIEQAHQPDEYLSIDRIQPTIAILEGLIQKFCL